MRDKNLIFCATLGSCVHVAGVFNFMQLAQQQGYETTFLRPPNTIKEIITKVKEINPDIVALSYRLTPESAVKIVEELQKELTPEMRGKKWILGGTTLVCKVVKPLGIFDRLFHGSTTEFDVISYLRSSDSSLSRTQVFPSDLIKRIEMLSPYPLIRTHFGVPSVEMTCNGIEVIAKAKLVDVISIGPDQNFQESFFNQEDMKELEKGSGGVPIRSKDDLIRMYTAVQRGNYPLLRCYSGTNNLIKMSQLLKDSIDNAWCATPLFWYSELDGRSNRSLQDAIKENQDNMKWHGERNIPFEANEAHQWSLRSSSDAIAVAAAFLGAYNAKKAGVRKYISQMMFNTPLGLSPRYDLAKMIAKTTLIESLHDENFKSYRQVRTGLLSFPEDLHLAKGQLASSIQIAMFMKPHIVHVVSYCEADHAATPEDVIESVNIARKVISNSIRGLPLINHDPAIESYKSRLIADALYIFQAIHKIIGEEVKDPLIHPPTLARAVKLGILGAPHLKGLQAASGDIHTSVVDGKSISINPTTGLNIPEFERINQILGENGFSLLDKERKRENIPRSLEKIIVF